MRVSEHCGSPDSHAFAGGLGGLATALSLLHYSEAQSKTCKITLLERAELISEVGAGSYTSGAPHPPINADADLQACQSLQQQRSSIMKTLFRTLMPNGLRLLKEWLDLDKAGLGSSSTVGVLRGASSIIS